MVHDAELVALFHQVPCPAQSTGGYQGGPSYVLVAADDLITWTLDPQSTTVGSLVAWTGEEHLALNLEGLMEINSSRLISDLKPWKVVLNP